MFKCVTRVGSLAVLGLFTSIGGSVAVAQSVSGGEFCDVLDPSSGLFSTCIQAHSAMNRIENLNEAGANDKSKAKAQEELDAALATYAELPGGGIVPGFSTTPPLIFAVAYINRDGTDGYSPGGTDELIAKLTDTNSDNIPGPGDTVTTYRFPADFTATEVGEFTILQHEVTSVVIHTPFNAIAAWVYTEDANPLPLAIYGFAGKILSDDCQTEAYHEADFGSKNEQQSQTTFEDISGSDCVSDFPDRIVITGTSPSFPSNDINEITQGNLDVDDAYIDVDVFLP